MEYVLKTNGLCKTYKDFKALQNLNMQVPKGSIYGFVGKNGAGKTTLIRVICGLQAPTSGEYTLYGRKHTDAAIGKSRRRMGAVVETPSIFPDMTAQDNLLQQYAILGVSDTKNAEKLLELVGLSGTGAKKAKNFSLGMRQRLGIAMALAGNPDFIVLDEPINGLDPEGIIEIRELILKLNHQNGITFLISSHILDELSKLATHYGFIDRGQIVKEISAEELENNCRKCIRVKVSDVKALVRILDQMNLGYQVRSDVEADIYANPSITGLVALLNEENCELLSVCERDESLESYYMSLVGGHHDA